MQIPLSCNKVIMKALEWGGMSLSVFYNVELGLRREIGRVSTVVHTLQDTPQSPHPGNCAHLQSSLIERELNFVTCLKPTECGRSDEMSLPI